MMDQRDQLILERAILYTDKLAAGINPLDDTRLAQSDAVNNEKMRRYLEYTGQILRRYRMIQLSSNSSKNKTPFSITKEQLSHYRFSDEPLTASAITQQITDLAANADMQRMKAADISAWMMKNGYLTEMPYQGKISKIPTDKGNAAGIYAAEAVNQANQPYIRLTYNRFAQQLIIANLDQIIGSYVRKDTDKKEAE